MPILTRYTLALSWTGERAMHEWAYRLYAALLEQAPPAFAQAIHNQATTPVSQYLCPDAPGQARWMVTLFGAAQAALGPVLETQKTWHLVKLRLTLAVTGRTCESVEDCDSFFAPAAPSALALRFLTPTAFKSGGDYVRLPTAWLLTQSLFLRWNGLLGEVCPIEDSDGGGIAVLAAGLKQGDFQLQSATYWLKGTPIPAFMGCLTLENTCSGFHRTLAAALFRFGGYAGTGIKTALGMGALEIQRNE